MRWWWIALTSTDRVAIGATLIGIAFGGAIQGWPAVLVPLSLVGAVVAAHGLAEEFRTVLAERDGDR